MHTLIWWWEMPINLKTNASTFQHTYICLQTWDVLLLYGESVYQVLKALVLGFQWCWVIIIHTFIIVHVIFIQYSFLIKALPWFWLAFWSLDSTICLGSFRLKIKARRLLYFRLLDESSCNFVFFHCHLTILLPLLLSRIQGFPIL